MSRTKQPAHGGRRPGAGRPRTPDRYRPVAVTVRVDRDTAARFSAWCARHGITQGRAFADWVRLMR